MGLLRLLWGLKKMYEEEKQHWMNQVAIGKGTLVDFAFEYNRLSKIEGQFNTASQLFPTGRIVEGQDNKCLEYEYAIYFKVKPQGIKVDMTEKEGREMDPNREPMDTDLVVI